MPKDVTPGKPTTRRYSPEEKAAAIRMVRTFRIMIGDAVDRPGIRNIIDGNLAA
jgi:hypothetical protein